MHDYEKIYLQATQCESALILFVREEIRRRVLKVARAGMSGRNSEKQVALETIINLHSRETKFNITLEKLRNGELWNKKDLDWRRKRWKEQFTINDRVPERCPF